MARNQADCDRTIVEILHDPRLRDDEAIKIISDVLSTSARWELCETLEIWEEDHAIPQHDTREEHEGSR